MIYWGADYFEGGDVRWREIRWSRMGSDGVPVPSLGETVATKSVLCPCESITELEGCGEGTMRRFWKGKKRSLTPADFLDQNDAAPNERRRMNWACKKYFINPSTLLKRNSSLRNLIFDRAIGSPANGAVKPCLIGRQLRSGDRPEKCAYPSWTPAIEATLANAPSRQRIRLVQHRVDIRRRMPFAF